MTSGPNIVRRGPISEKGPDKLTTFRFETNAWHPESILATPEVAVEMYTKLEHILPAHTVLMLLISCWNIAYKRWRRIMAGWWMKSARRRGERES